MIRSLLGGVPAEAMDASLGEASAATPEKQEATRIDTNKTALRRLMRAMVLGDVMVEIDIDGWMRIFLYLYMFGIRPQ